MTVATVIWQENGKLAAADQMLGHLESEDRTIDLPARTHLAVFEAVSKILSCLAFKQGMRLTHHRQIMRVRTTNCGVVSMATIVSCRDPVTVEFNGYRIANFHTIEW